MAECKYVPQCPFYHNRMEEIPGTGERIRDQYCRNQPEDCARYKLYELVDHRSVPYNLFPHQRSRVPAILLEKAEQVQAIHFKELKLA